MAEINDELKPETPPDYFSQTGEDYAKYRPGYSEKVFDDLLTEVPGRDIAVDCGCGTGQIAGALGSRFERVYGVDISKDQLAHAVQAPNIQYLNQGAEDLKFLPDGSVDLITAGTAYHWFDSEKFWPEARRVLKPGGVVAILQIRTPDIKEVPGLFGKLMETELHPHIPPSKASGTKLSEQVPGGFKRATPDLFSGPASAGGRPRRGGAPGLHIGCDICQGHFAATNRVPAGCR